MDPVTMAKNFMLNTVKQGLSPKNMVMKYFNQNPIVGNLINLAESGNQEEVENIARNICKEKGRDFDKEFSEFRKKFE